MYSNCIHITHTQQVYHNTQMHLLDYILVYCIHRHRLFQVLYHSPRRINSELERFVEFYQHLMYGPGAQILGLVGLTTATDGGFQLVMGVPKKKWVVYIREIPPRHG